MPYYRKMLSKTTLLALSKALEGMDTRWLSLVSPLPPLFPLPHPLPHPFAIGPFPRIPLLPQIAPLIKKDKSKQFLVEQLLPSDDEKPPPSPLVQLPKALPTVLPTQPLEFVNGGYGMKNPLATGSNSRDETTATASDHGQYNCRVCEIRAATPSKSAHQVSFRLEEIPLYVLRQRLQ
ncbi:hypothetical protein ANCCAN_16145 [Ancylostoma caninum]|uniref:Uncharacterized protein n=1 Tax=Ancylostoma caninum TaxID=29170 RepID=A0A368G3V5_ANCCA|nr:hypothetical protein ANCCAN_16145 [Ancylostoma caninum]